MPVNPASLEKDVVSSATSLAPCPHNPSPYLPPNIEQPPSAEQRMPPTAAPEYTAGTHGERWARQL